MAGDIIMSQQQDHDAEFTALLTEIKDAYHQQPLEQPSAELDEAILAKARAGAHVSAQSKKSTKSLWQRNAWAFSSAASVLLVAGLFMLNPSIQQQVGIDLEPSSSVQPALLQQTKRLSADAATEKSIVVEGLSSSAERGENQPLSRGAANIESASAAPAQSDTKQAVVPKDNEAQSPKNALGLQSLANNNEVQLMKQQDESSLKGDIHLDTPDVALARLSVLMADNKLIQAERYMLTIDQRFPELSDPSHPLYEQYHKIKLQLTSR